MMPTGPETHALAGSNGTLVVGRRVYRQAVVTSILEQVPRQRPDGVSAQAKSLVGSVLEDGADHRAVDLYRVADRSIHEQLVDRLVWAERGPPASNFRLLHDSPQPGPIG